jgi:hypothetical protein
MGLALSGAAKHKLVGLLSQRLKKAGIYVGKVMTFASIKGTPGGDATSIEPSIVAEKFWQLYEARGKTYAAIRRAS